MIKWKRNKIIFKFERKEIKWKKRLQNSLSGGVLYNNTKLYVIALLVVLLLSGIGITYAYISAIDQSKKSAVAVVGGKTACIDVSLETLNESELNGLAYNYPITDEYAKENIIPTKLKISNKCSEEELDYTLILTSLKDSDKYIPSSLIKIKLDKEESELIEPVKLSKIKDLGEGTTKTILETELNKTYSQYTKESKVLDKDKIEPSSSITYETYLWIDYEADNSIAGYDYKDILSIVINNPEESVETGINETITTLDIYNTMTGDNIVTDCNGMRR